jgi:sec-independent protein translocase protein TatA
VTGITRIVSIVRPTPTPCVSRTLQGVVGLPEIIVLVVIVLIIVGHRRIPEIARGAGNALRSGVDKARGLSSSVGKRVDEKVDPSSIGRSAGRTLREVRETRDAFTGKEPPKDETSESG